MKPCRPTFVTVLMLGFAAYFLQQIFYLIYGHKVVQTFYITGDIKRQIPCCLPPSDTDKARGWKTACQKVKFIYKPIACLSNVYISSWSLRCIKKMAIMVYFCCDGQTLEDQKCLLRKLPPVSVCGWSRYVDAGTTVLEDASTSREYEFPWQVSLRVGSYTGLNHLCGGSIISKYLIVTAANCAIFIREDSDYVIVGVHDIRTMPNDGVYPIVKVVLYPGYKEHSIKDDIAVIKGDPGAPVVYRNPNYIDSTFELVGVFLFGYSTPFGQLGVFTMVTEYLDWINHWTEKFSL
ncbi:hypothetical protein LSH36_12g06002 [Paralvinella palmiformis]|uniref:Peptidase S1 domain-containing protein n=1 Tax=Paralvinella palmiformis TaxID=53620 RepID=A0AAD9KD05_9ANNE|nr:hypothetical protein LSH36_12g06002 [Paralvinella palmiformis]